MDSGGTGASKARARVRPPRAVHATARPNMCALLLLQRAVDYRANRHICEAAGCRSRHEACSGAGGAAILLGERNPLARLSGTRPRPAPSASTPCQPTRRSPRLRVGHSALCAAIGVFHRRFADATSHGWMDGHRSGVGCDGSLRRWTRRSTRGTTGMRSGSSTFHMQRECR